LRGALLGALVAAVAAVVATPAALAAQAPDGRRGGQDREQLEQRIRAQMGRMMQERLGLDEDQAAILATVVQDFEGRRRELFGLEQATRRRVEALLLEDSDDEAEAQQLLDQMAELRLREAELFAAEQAALLDVLTPVQVLQLQELREDLGRRIRALRGGRGGPGDGRRGPGPGAFRDRPPAPADSAGAPPDRIPLG
jgi:Spy/CpxP family protein refolding chaperone